MVNFEMPRNKRHCKTGATVKFSQPTDKEDGKGSYESKLREWRKVRDSLETEGTYFVNALIINTSQPLYKNIVTCNKSSGHFQ